ncbi:hypothetical protein L9F63_000996, partial [Diploptera punctata]
MDFKIILIILLFGTKLGNCITCYLCGQGAGGTPAECYDKFHDSGFPCLPSLDKCYSIVMEEKKEAIRTCYNKGYQTDSMCGTPGYKCK